MLLRSRWRVALASRAGESRWRVALAIGWGIFVTYAATMAVIAFGESEGVVIGTLGAFAGAALMAAFVGWGARGSLRSERDEAIHPK
jgi:hypothetical protein